MKSRPGLIFIILIAASVASGFVFIGTALTGLLLLAWAALVLRLAFKNGSAALFPIGGWMLAWLAWLSVGVWTSTAHNVSWQTAWVLAGLPIAYLGWGMTPDPARIWGALRTMLLLAGPVFALWGLGQVVTGYGNGQPVGPLVDRNAFAALMNLFWFTASVYFIRKVHEGGWRLILQGMGMLLIAMTLFAAESRGATLSWLLLMPAVLWAGYKSTRNMRAAMLVLAIALAGYAGTAGLLGLNVAHRTVNIEQDTSSNARLQLWKSAAEITRDHPVFGTGWGTFAASYPAYRDPNENTTAGLYAHNDYIQLATEGGITALILLLGIFACLLLQLKRSLSLTENPDALEATGLLLGVLALFIHAWVNFIFYFAFMNILAGLLAARAIQLINPAHHVDLSGWFQIGRVTKALMGGVIALLLAGPLFLQLFAQLTLTGSQPGLALMQKVWPQASAYRIAKFVSAVRPSLGIAQELMLQAGDEALKDSDGISMQGGNFQRELLNEALDRYELVRAQTADSPAYGVREARLLMRYRDLLEPDSALRRARDILEQNLRLDPFHADSMIELSRLDVAEGHAGEARQYLAASMQRVLTRRDQQLLVVEMLRQRAAPRKIAELDLIEKKLRSVQSSSETGRNSMLDASFSENVDRRLKEISGAISD